MSEDLKKSVAGHDVGLWDRMAASYDRVGVEFFKPIAERLVHELGPRPSERVLDLGCGRGAALFALATAVGPHGHVIGIDSSPQMVAATATEAAELGQPIEVRVGDAMAPPFEPQSFDVVTSSMVLFFLPDPLQALRTWRQLLVSGGRAGVSTFGEPSPWWRKMETVFTPYLSTPLSRPRMPRSSPFSSDAGMEDLLSEAGFVDVCTTTMTVQVCFDDEEHWERWSWSVGHRRFWEAVRPEHRGEARKAAYRALENYRDGEYRIGFDQAARLTLASVRNSL
jgi:ubiquinone/menaquinone biosynthesis C-methylase UbiE